MKFFVVRSVGGPATSPCLFLASREEQERTKLLNTTRPEAAARFVTREAAELLCPLPTRFVHGGVKRRRGWHVDWEADEAPDVVFEHPSVPKCPTCIGSVGGQNLTIHSETCSTRWTSLTENELALHTIKVVSEEMQRKKESSSGLYEWERQA